MGKKEATCWIAVLLVAVLATLAANAAQTPDSVLSERRAFRRAVYAGTPARRAAALQKGLKSGDPLVRRQTLWELYADSRAAASRALLSMTADPAEEVGLMVVRLAGCIPAAEKRAAFLRRVVQDSPLPSVREAAVRQMRRGDDELDADNNVSADVNALSPFGACVSRLDRSLGAALRNVLSLRKAATGPRPAGAEASSDDLLVWPVKCGAANYVFVVNDVPGDDRTVSGNIRLAGAAGAVYDLERHAAVPFSVSGGRTTVPVEVPPRGAVALMAVPEPLKPLHGVSAQVRGGLAVTLYSREKGILVPVEIRAPGLREPCVAIIDGGAWDQVFAGMRLPVSVKSLADGTVCKIVE